MKILNLIIGWLLANALLACSPGQGEQQGTYEGKDIKEEFLKEHNGEYQFPDGWSGYQNSKSLKINEDGTFEIAFENYRVDPIDKLGRTAICSGVRRGKIVYIKKIDADVDHLTTGLYTSKFGTVKHLDAYLYLSGSEYEFTQTKTEKYSRITQRSEHLTGDMEFTANEYQEACGSWSRYYPETVYIERILPTALVLSDARGGRNALSERFATKNSDEWIWITGGLARDLVAEASERLSVRFEGVAVDGVEPDALKQTNRSFDMSGKIEIDDTGIFKLGVGTTLLEHFYPMMTLEGRLAGISYQPKSKALGMLLTKPLSVTVPPTKLSFNTIEHRLQNMLGDESVKFNDVKQKIDGKPRETLGISMNMAGTKLLNFSTKK